MKKKQLKDEQVRTVVREKIPESNIIVSKTLIIFSGICVAVWLLFQFGFLESKGLFVTTSLIVTPILFVSSAAICLYRKGRGAAFQYIFLVLLAVFWLELELMSGYKSKLLLPVLIILSLRYYNKKFIIFTFISCVLALLASVYCNAFLYVETELIDLNLVYLEQSHDVTLNGFIYNSIIDLLPSEALLFANGLRLNFMPNTIFLAVITVLVIRFMNYNLQNIVDSRELAVSEANHMVELSDMKTKLLLSQIQPHFIYNTLTTIAYFCQEDPAKAEELTNYFSGFLQNNLGSLSENREIPFSKELNAIRNYLNIEAIRFEERIRIEYDIKTDSFMVPVLSIQPIVENAVKHGICRKKGGGTVWLSTAEEENCFIVTIKDDGAGFDMAAVESDGKEHVGIKNISARISDAGGDITINSTINEGTTVVVRFPKEREEC